MAYTAEQLAVICPLCHAAKGGKCLEGKKDGMQWIDSPHIERVKEADRCEEVQ